MLKRKNLIIFLSVLVALTAIAIYFLVYKNKNEAQNLPAIIQLQQTNDSVSKVKPEPNKPITTKKYTDPDGKFSFTYAKELLLSDTCQPGSNEDFIGVQLATKKDYMTLCGSDKPAQMHTHPPISNDGPTLSPNCKDFTPNSPKDSCKNTKVDGREASRTYSVVNYETLNPKGTIYIGYVVGDGNGKAAFQLRYTQLPSWPNKQSEFESIVKSFNVL